MNRVVAAGVTALILVGLVIWHNYRWSLVDNCHVKGGVWDGTVSKCRLVPARIFIGKGLKRT